jgi:replication initiation and membrane attachment protein DnaB
MELFPPLSGFYEAIEDDVRIGTTHISLYMALLQQWNLAAGRNPFLIERVVIMKAAKINARYTYNKCMNNLQEFGYITYLPSSNQFTNSTVYLKGL